MSIAAHRTAFSFTDADGIEISAYEWAPAAVGDGAGAGPRGGAPTAEGARSAADDTDRIGIVQISHGIGEHALRYDAFARDLVAAGFVVYADDHRGHGETGRRQYGGDLTRLGRLGPGGLRATEAAILRLTAIAREKHPGLPLTMFGHSWGSLMAQRIVNREPRVFDAVVLSGSAFRSPKHMEGGDLNTRWAEGSTHGFEWLSREPETAEQFVADELCFAANIPKLFGLTEALKLYGKPGSGLAPDVPILIISGGDDPLNRTSGRGSDDGLRRLAEAYRARGVTDVTLKIYPGARHELLNETNRDEAITDIITWLTDRAANGSLVE